ncbi:sigma-70 family RNA polymerase sigma factor [Sphingobium sp.]|uniref:sigma-70 family RNA polymerase sigma factor n=1 Tax=Sphingobium sp. TaxID=1912891 RepID=UPI003B3BC5D4
MAQDQHIADFEAERPRLLRIGYRMLGSLAEAEDVVQDAWLRWERVEGGVDSPAAYLTRVVTRLCLDQLKSARARREVYVGPWLPEPLMEPAEAEDRIADDVTLSLMMAMERLSPLERATFLLHDIFDVALTEVSAILGREPAAVRQLASRARRHVRAERPRYPVGAAEADRIASAFFIAARDGDAAALSALLARDVQIHADGGGKVIAFHNVIHGAERAIRLFKSQRRKQVPVPVLLRTAMIDGLPGYVSIDRASVLQTTALDVRDGRIVAIYMMRNPDKLGHVRMAMTRAAPADLPLQSGAEGSKEEP